MKKDLFWAFAMLVLALIIVWLVVKEAEAFTPHQPAAPSPQGEGLWEDGLQRPVKRDSAERAVSETECAAPEWQDYVLRVITAEGGTDFGVCAGVTQCLFNACEKDGWNHTPKEMMIRYRWTSPASFISAEAERAYDEIFCSGVTYTAFGNATVFYAPAYCDSSYHESQRFV